MMLSPPGACASSGRVRQAARSSPSRRSTSSRRSPSHSPWPISSSPGSDRSRPGVPFPPEMAAATMAAVSVARLSGELTISSGGRAGIGSAGGSAGLARRAAARADCWRPSSVRGVSVWPWKRSSAMNLDWPCRSRTMLASTSAGTLSRPSRGGSPTGRGPPRAPGLRQRSRPAHRRQARAP